MNKIYIVWQDGEEDPLAIYSSREEAQKAADKISSYTYTDKSGDYYYYEAWVEEFDVMDEFNPDDF